MQAPLLILLALLVAYGVTHRLLGFFLKRLVDTKDVPIARKALIRKTIWFAHGGTYVLAAGLVLGVTYGELTLFLSSFFAVLGVALFAQWSILSNVTASVLIFFQFPYRIGDEIMIPNKDFDLSGIIEEIGSFHVLIRRKDGVLLTYPNSLILQTPVIKMTEGSRGDVSESPDGGGTVST